MCEFKTSRTHCWKRGFFYLLSSAGNFKLQNRDLLKNAASAVSSTSDRTGLDIKDMVNKNVS